MFQCSSGLSVSSSKPGSARYPPMPATGVRRKHHAHSTDHRLIISTSQPSLLVHVRCRADIMDLSATPRVCIPYRLIDTRFCHVFWMPVFTLLLFSPSKMRPTAIKYRSGKITLLGFLQAHSLLRHGFGCLRWWLVLPLLHDHVLTPFSTFSFWLINQLLLRTEPRTNVHGPATSHPTLFSDPFIIGAHVPSLRENVGLATSGSPSLRTFRNALSGLPCEVAHTRTWGFTASARARGSKSTVIRATASVRGLMRTARHGQIKRRKRKIAADRRAGEQRSRRRDHLLPSQC